MCVIACNDGVPLVVESAREDFIGMSLQHLQARSRARTPHACCLIHACCQNAPPLRIKTNLWCERERQKANNISAFCYDNAFGQSFVVFPQKQLLFFVLVGTSFFNVIKREKKPGKAEGSIDTLMDRKKTAELNLTCVDVTGEACAYS